MADFDPGPPAAVARHFARVPSYADYRDLFWHDWGPVFYRGRLDGSARVLCVASDPGPTERIAGRCLVGNAGQRVQGLLTKLGMTRSYVCLNAWCFALHPSRASAEKAKLREPAQLAWRNELYDRVAGPSLQAVIGFGVMAQEAVRLWSEKPNVPVFEVPTRPAAPPKSYWTPGAPSSPSCASSSPRTLTATTPGPTTGGDSPKRITRPFPAGISPSGPRRFSATTPGSGCDRAGRKTRSTVRLPMTSTR